MESLTATTGARCYGSALFLTFCLVQMLRYIHVSKRRHQDIARRWVQGADGARCYAVAKPQLRAEFALCLAVLQSTLASQ